MGMMMSRALDTVAPSRYSMLERPSSPPPPPQPTKLTDAELDRLAEVELLEITGGRPKRRRPHSTNTHHGSASKTC